MHYVEWPAKLGNVCGRFGIEISERKLDNGWRIDDAAVAFSKPTRTGCDRLLTQCKDVAIGPYAILSITPPCRLAQLGTYMSPGLVGASKTEAGFGKCIGPVPCPLDEVMELR